MGHGRGSATSKQGAKRSGVTRSVGVSSYGMKTQLRDIDEWTAGAYGDVRKAQRGETDLEKLTQEQAEAVAASLEALTQRQVAPIEGKLWRGVSMEQSDFDKIKVGDVVSQQETLSSWSRDGGTAFEFALHGGENVKKPTPVIFLMVNGTKKGADLTNLSSKRGESEIAISSTSKQRVLEIVYDAGLQANIVVVEEV